MRERICFDYEGEITHLQTHSSHVFLVGGDVYKVKKPVDFGFLDYSTLEKRERFCRREVELNRRFSPEVYRGVVKLTARTDGRLEIGGRGEILEYAVHMRRLPGEAMLHLRLKAGDVRPEEMAALADVLGAFYAGAETSPEISRFGEIAQIRENTVENFEQTMDFEEELLPDSMRRTLIEKNERFLTENEELFAKRIEEGKVLDGHGDLKPENLFFTAGGPVVTDCIEFNERFRYGDVLVDIGYLTMGLLAAGRPDLREAFLRRFREVSDPGFPMPLLRYYETYRAVVKGKIEGFRSRQAEVPEIDRARARAAAWLHFGLAATESE